MLNRIEQITKTISAYAFNNISIIIPFKDSSPFSRYEDIDNILKFFLNITHVLKIINTTFRSSVEGFIVKAIIFIIYSENQFPFLSHIGNWIVFICPAITI